MAKKDFTKIGNASYRTSYVTSFPTFEAFKQAMDTQMPEASGKAAKAAPEAHFKAWGDQRDVKLREVYDAATANSKAQESSAGPQTGNVSNPPPPQPQTDPQSSDPMPGKVKK